MNSHDIARDDQQYALHSNGQDWLVSWHPPSRPPPEGKRHGSAAVCFTLDGQVVLGTEDGIAWGLPGGRPEGNEDWRDTLYREVLEEACARVTWATLLGYSRGACIHGHEAGLVIVRALWYAEVELQPWEPRFEITQRLLMPLDEALEMTKPNEIYRRLFQAAMAIRTSRP
jgi:ADP-ribose pyrophosphatase YjhB (NUDIX family)